MRKSICVKQVVATDNYELILTFNTNEKKMFDVKPYLTDKFWAPLKNLAIFKRAKISGPSVAWGNDEIDFCPDELYQNSVAINERKSYRREPTGNLIQKEMAII